MKSFTQFLSEASAASAQALKLNLKSDGHGGWYNNRGEFVAKTEQGKLKFYGKNQKPGEKDEPRTQKASVAQPIAKPKAAAPAPAAKRAKAGEPPEKGAPEQTQDLTIVFGRFNPPTTGHEKLLQMAKKTAAGGSLKIYPSRTQDPKKNPLDPDMKASYMRKMFPEFEEEIINDPEMKSIFDVLTTADEDGYENVNIVVGSDRQSEFESLAQKYNGDLYDFEEIRVISAGVRDADAEGVEGMSASKLRKAVADDDFDTFKRGTPNGLKLADAQALYDAVRTGMNVKKTQKESYDLWEIAPRQDPRGLRENYLLEKIFNLGQFVENLNTGLIGKVIRRGTNYLICVTEQDNMFKSWIHDVMETTKPKEKKPDTRIGTNAYYKYAVKMAPGSQEGAQNLLPGQKPYTIKEFINKYRKK